MSCAPSPTKITMFMGGIFTMNLMAGLWHGYTHILLAKTRLPFASGFPVRISLVIVSASGYYEEIV